MDEMRGSLSAEKTRTVIHSTSAILLGYLSSVLRLIVTRPAGVGVFGIQLESFTGGYVRGNGSRNVNALESEVETGF